MKNTFIFFISFFIITAINAQNNRHRHRNHKRNVVHKKHKRIVKARRTAHIKYKGLPARGVLVSNVGTGFTSIKFGGVGYRFHKGIYYKMRGSKFVVVRAPIGIRIKTLPVGHRRLLINRRPYFYYYGTYYQKSEENTGTYEVVDAPLGAEVDSLPEGYKIVTANEREYYMLDNVYYEPRINDQDEEYYVVVSDPTK